MNQFKEWLSDNLRYLMLAATVIIGILLILLGMRVYRGISGGHEVEGPAQQTTEQTGTSTTGNQETGKAETEMQTPAAVTEVQTEVQTEAKTEAAAEPRTEVVTEKETEAQTEVATEKVTEAQTEEATEKVTEAQTEEATEKVTEAQTEEATEKVTEAQTEEATEKVTEAQTEEATEKVTEAQTEEATEKVTEVQTEVATEKVTEARTEEATEKVTETQTEAVTEKQTEAQTEAVTEQQTEAVTEKQTEAQTEVVTENETEVQTETVTEEQTESVTERTGTLYQGGAPEAVLVGANAPVSGEKESEDATEEVSEKAEENAEENAAGGSDILSEDAISAPDIVVLEWLTSPAAGESVSSEGTAPSAGSEAAPDTEAETVKTITRATEKETEEIDTLKTLSETTKYASTDLNIRSGPGTKYRILMEAQAGQEVAITGETTSWYRVRTDKGTGYISKSLLADEYTPTYVTINSACYVRSYSDYGDNIIAELWGGETVELLADLGGWAQIRVNGVTGYVGSKFIY